jgi:hypothetical protein
VSIGTHKQGSFRTQGCSRSLPVYSKEEGCTEPSEMCIKAANALSKADEEKYLELCTQSCVKCGEAKRPQPKKDAYVA